jgi:AcrR family transcriptional regulator
MRDGAPLGRRERKRLAMREHIADVATRLFIARGFDEVTVAEVAETADVAEKTVYNHFRTKEDLFFDRDIEIGESWVRAVGDRLPGEGPLAGLRRRVREDAAHSAGHGFLRTIQQSSRLSARARSMINGWQDLLAGALRTELRLATDDPLPELIAAQAITLGSLVERLAERWRDAGADDATVAARAETMIDRCFDLLEQPLEHQPTPAPLGCQT